MSHCTHHDSDGHSTYEPSKRGTHEVCRLCEDRFPCSASTCAHYDCRPARGQQFKCYSCDGQLAADAQGDTWGTMHKRGGTVTIHYCCRDADARTARADIVARARGPHPYYPEPCSHDFEDKAPMDLAMLKSMASAKRD